jgi:hypothetical protein
MSRKVTTVIRNLLRIGYPHAVPASTLTKKSFRHSDFDRLLPTIHIQTLNSTQFERARKFLLFVAN